MTGRLLIPGLIAASVCAVFAACLLGSTPMPADRVLAAFFGGADAGDRLVIWQIRLPRALAAYLTGAALGISEGFFRLSVGIEDPDLLIAELTAAVAAAKATL